jgi:hypothetical protein
MRCLLVLALVASEAACMCTEAQIPARQYTIPVTALPLRALRGGRQEDGPKDLSQIRAATWEELDDKGYIEAGLESQEHSGPSEYLDDDQYPPPVALERLQRPTTGPSSAAAAGDGGTELAGIVEKVSDMLRARGSKEAHAPSKSQEAHEVSAAATAPAEADASTGMRGEGEQEREEDVQEDDPLPQTKALDGTMYLGGRTPASVLSWGDEDLSARCSSDQSRDHAGAEKTQTRTLWSHKAGDVRVPEDSASVADALAAARPSGCRILLRGGRYFLGPRPLKIASVQVTSRVQLNMEI